VTIRHLIEKYWRPDIALCVGALTLSAAILGTDAITLGNLREETLRSVEANMESQAIVLAQESDRSFKVLDLALSIIADHITRLGVNDSEALQGRLAGRDVHEFLKEKSAGLSHVDAISLVSAHGKLINVSRRWPIPDVDVSDRDFFQALKFDAALNVFIGKPVQNRTTGAWTIYVARRLSAPNGSFMGMVLGAITLEHFEQFFHSIAQQEGSAVTLMRQDGMPLARYPRSDHIDKVVRVAASMSRTKIVNARHIESPVDRQIWILSARPLAGYPLVVAVSQTEESALRSWRRFADHSTSMTLLRIFVVLLMGLAASRWWQKQRSLTRELTLQNLRFDAALDNMGEGLCMFDAEKRLVVCNDRYAKLYRLPPELLEVGTLHSAIIAHRVAHGILKGETDEGAVKHKISALGQLPADATSSRIDELSDGRLICVTRQPMEGGGWVATHADVTEQQRSEAKIIHMAHHDALTDLPNRVLLRERLEHALTGTRRGDHSLAVLVLDLDRFKEINDTLGHPVGDLLLKAVAERLRTCAREEATIARLGGDEFAIVEKVADPGIEATVLAERLQTALSAPFDLGDHQAVVGLSIGIAIAPGDGVDPDHLLKNADLALYRAKAEGRGSYRFFEPEMDTRMHARRALEVDLRKALVNGEFELYYQPFVNLERNEISGFEALLRWHHPERGMVSPAEFIPVAEENGLIVPIGEWVLRQACAEAATWPDNIKVAVNLSPAQFKNPNLVQMVFSALTVSGLSGRRVELEITESALLESNATTLAAVHQLRALGIQIAMDDFGTGYSSLSYLQNFPFDKIKIDRSFVKEVTHNSSSASIIRAVVSIAADRNMITTAEGVETLHQRQTVQNLGCTQMQGYLFSAARPASEIRGLLGSGAAGAEAAA
jgi:diguanylate cyclase (GGDEF)-like protein